MDKIFKEIMNISSYDDIGKNRKYIDYGNSIFSNIIVPIMYFLLLIYHGFIKLDIKEDIFAYIENLLNNLPGIVLAVINIVFEIIYITGTLIYSNYNMFLFSLIILMLIIIFIGNKEWFYEKFLNKETQFNDGLIKKVNFITAFRRIFYFIIFSMTDFWVIYSFASIHLGKEIISVTNRYVFKILFIVYFIKLVILIFIKLFDSCYYEDYGDLKIDGYMDRNNDIFYRFMVLNYKKIDVNTYSSNNKMKYKHVYFLKDTYIKENRFLCILVEEFENKKKYFLISKKYYSNDFDEVKYVFEKYIKEVEQ